MKIIQEATRLLAHHRGLITKGVQCSITHQYKIPSQFQAFCLALRYLMQNYDEYWLLECWYHFSLLQPEMRPLLLFEELCNSINLFYFGEPIETRTKTVSLLHIREKTFAGIHSSCRSNNEFHEGSRYSILTSSCGLTCDFFNLNKFYRRQKKKVGKYSRVLYYDWSTSWKSFIHWQKYFPKKIRVLSSLSEASIFFHDK